MPADEGRRTSQPQPTAAVEHDRIDVGKRNPIVLAETLDPAVTDVAKRRVLPVALPIRCHRDSADALIPVRAFQVEMAETSHFSSRTNSSEATQITGGVGKTFPDTPGGTGQRTNRTPSNL